MLSGPTSLLVRTVGEWVTTSARPYGSPFADVQVEGVFEAPDGRKAVMPAFFDGDGVWRLRFNPDVAGEWRVALRSVPTNPDFTGTAAFTVEGGKVRGFVRSAPGKHFGFDYENGEPFFPMGDTVYDIFGMAHCGGDVEAFLDRRAKQGFNIIRARLCSSSFHPPDAHFEWQNRPMWVWGGSTTAPRFDLLNLDWFKSVDRTMWLLEERGLGVELIMEGWGFEFPFNHRAHFTTEWEQVWMRYLIARYDAFTCVHSWTPLNEYEYYPNGDWHWKPVSDRYAIRVSRWIKSIAPHGHIITAHNGPVLPPFAERFAADPEAVDSIMYQSWGTRGEDDGWLAAGIDETIATAFKGWAGSAVLAEWGYERNPAFENKIPAHEFCDRNHSRRGAWRAAMFGMGNIYGQEPSWGPWMVLDLDLPGVADMMVLRDFAVNELTAEHLEPAAEIVKGDFRPGFRPLAIRGGQTTAVYYPAGGSAEIASGSSTAQWFDPRTGTYQAATEASGWFKAPAGVDVTGRPLDYVLLLKR